MATEKLGRMADAALSDERAQPLFDQATEHFKDSTSNCLVQWASVMITKVGVARENSAGWITLLVFCNTTVTQLYGRTQSVGGTDAYYYIAGRVVFSCDKNEL